MLGGCDLIVGLDRFKLGDEGDGGDAGGPSESNDGAGEPKPDDDGAPDSGESTPDGGGENLGLEGGVLVTSEGGAPVCTGLTCDGVCVPANSTNHCGTCDHDCTSLANVTGPVSCNAGQCAFAAAACAPGYAHCSSNADDGCEVDITQAAHCGQCGGACVTPTPLCVGTDAQYSCASGCNASAPTLCGQTCINTSVSPLHCNGCGMACPAVTGGQATCQSGQCGFTCNADRHRCGNSCAANDSITQCGSTCVTCAQPAGGTAACVSGSCTLSCGTDYIKSANTCLSRYLYVSPTGNDSNNGTSIVTPLRSFGHAMGMAVSGQTVRFAQGTYGSATGDTFSQQVPSGVNLERNGSAGTVTFQSNGTGSFVLAGSSNLSSITLDNFALPIGITTGTQTLSDVAFTNTKGAAIISGNARVSYQSGGFSGAPSATEMLLVQDTATLTWSGGSLASMYADCLVTTSGLRALGSSKITLTGLRLTGTWNSSSQTAPLYFDTDGAIDIASGAFNNECDASNATMVVRTSATATLNVFNTFMGAQLLIEPIASVKIRQTSFHSAAGLYFTGSGHPTIDLGRTGDLGGNSFGSTTTTAVLAFGSNDMIIEAAGNTWVPNLQGADSSGHYPSGTTLMNPTNGRNFNLIGTNNLVRF